MCFCNQSVTQAYVEACFRFVLDLFTTKIAHVPTHRLDIYYTRDQEAPLRPNGISATTVILAGAAIVLVKIQDFSRLKLEHCGVSYAGDEQPLPLIRVGVRDSMHVTMTQRAGSSLSDVHFHFLNF